MNEMPLEGQESDYLRTLKSIYGVEWHSAIVSIYDEWRFYWLRVFCTKLPERRAWTLHQHHLLYSSFQASPLRSKINPTVINLDTCRACCSQQKTCIALTKKTITASYSGLTIYTFCFLISYLVPLFLYPCTLVPLQSFARSAVHTCIQQGHTKPNSPTSKDP